MWSDYNGYSYVHGNNRRYNGDSSEESEDLAWDWPDGTQERFIFFYLMRHSSLYPDREFKKAFNHNIGQMPEHLREWYDAANEATNTALNYNRSLKDRNLSTSEKLLSIDVKGGSQNLRALEEIGDQYSFRFSITQEEANTATIFGERLMAVLMYRVNPSGGGPLHGLADISKSPKGKINLIVRVCFGDQEVNDIRKVRQWSIKFLGGMRKDILLPSEERNNTTNNNDELHNTPEYIFRKQILNWELDRLDAAPEVPENIVRIAQTYEHVTDYYNAFRPRIYEEVRASIEQGLSKKQQFRFEITMGAKVTPEFARDTNDPNPSKLMLDMDIPKAIVDEYTENEVVVQLSPKGAKELKLIGLLNRNRQNNGASASDGYNIKFIISNDQRMMFANAFRPGKPWEVFALTSLSSYMRLYALTQSELRSSVQRAIVRSRGLSPWPDSAHNESEVASLNAFSLNELQRDYIPRYLKAGNGLYPLQGPPGTGKTTTICALLDRLYRNGRRVLVCAPSNQAVQVIAKRFYQQHENVPMLYIGVDGKLDKSLSPIFHDRWAEQQLKHVTEAVRLVNDRQLYPQDLLTKKTAPAYKEKLKLLNDKLHALNSKLNYARSFTSVNFPTMLLNQLSQWLVESMSIEDFIKHLNPIITARKQALELQAQEIREQKQDTEKQTQKNKKQKNPVSSKEIDYSKLPKLPGVEEFDRFQQHAAQSIAAAESTLLSNAKIVFCTLVTSARQSIREYYNEKFSGQAFFDDVVIDEAGQATELEAMLPFGFYKIPKGFMVGDTNQLPPTVISEKNKDTYKQNGQVIRGANYRRSMMKRLQENDINVPSLEVQYRMEEEIQRFPSQQCYGGKLRPSQEIEAGRNQIRPFLREQVPAYRFLHCDGKQNAVASSLENQGEANVIMRIVKYLIAIDTIDPASHIGIITFYRAQVNLIRKLLDKDNATKNIKVSTVDSFQGAENAIIILSLVRSSTESLGFVEEFERLNVALTRAMFALYVVGNKKAFTATKSTAANALPMAYKLVPDAEKRNVLVNAEIYLRSIEPQKTNNENKKSANNGKGKIVVDVNAVPNVTTNTASDSGVTQANSNSKKTFVKNTKGKNAKNSTKSSAVENDIANKATLFKQSSNIELPSAASNSTYNDIKGIAAQLAEVNLDENKTPCLVAKKNKAANKKPDQRTASAPLDEANKNREKKANGSKPSSAGLYNKNKKNMKGDSQTVGTRPK